MPSRRLSRVSRVFRPGVDDAEYLPTCNASNLRLARRRGPLSSVMRPRFDSPSLPLLVRGAPRYFRLTEEDVLGLRLCCPRRTMAGLGVGSRATRCARCRRRSRIGWPAADPAKDAIIRTLRRGHDFHCRQRLDGPKGVDQPWALPTVQRSHRYCERWSLRPAPGVPRDLRFFWPR